MGFTKPSLPRVQLNEYKDQPVAIQFISRENGIKVELPDGTSPTRDNVVLAKVASVASGAAAIDGESLVFYEVVGRQVERNAPEWVVGVLEQVRTGRSAPDGTEQTYFQLTEMDDEDHNAFVSMLQDAGIG